MLIAQALEEMSVKCKDARGSVSRFLLEHKADIDRYTMQQIADATYTSRPTLVRIAKRMGYSGWNELIKKYSAECRYYADHFSHVSPNVPFDKGETPRAIADKIGHVMVESILDTLELLDSAELERAARMLARARHIALLCISPNSLLAELFQRKMLQIGVHVQLVSQAEQFFLAQSLTPEDCAIAISYSGNNEQRAPMRYLNTLKENGVPIIAVTSAGDNLLRSRASCTLTISSREKLYSKIATFATEESIALLLNALYGCYFALDYERNLAYKINSSRAIELQRISTVQETMEDDRAFPLRKPENSEE